MSRTPTSKARFDFIGKRRTFAFVSVAAVIASLVLLVVPGPRYGIDFAGGTNVIARFTSDVSVAEVREAVAAMGVVDGSVQRFGEDDDVSYLVQTQQTTTLRDERRDAFVAAVEATVAGTEIEFDEATGDRVYLRVPTTSFEIDGSGEAINSEDSLALSSRADEISAALTAALAAADFSDVGVESYGVVRDHRFMVRVQAMQGWFTRSFEETFGERFSAIDRVETVGPRVGRQLRDDGIAAVLISLVCILLYIAFRFDLRYAPGAVVALSHDIIITLGVFVILQQEISLPIIAALLTIIGYSLNDTIINFDRVRENLNMGTGESLPDLVNRSVNECLSRTVLTSFTTLSSSLLSSVVV
jgi:preprotein translocase subunit SecF